MAKLTLKWIREKIKKGEYLWTLHADQERRNDGLEIFEIEKAILKRGYRRISRSSVWSMLYVEKNKKGMLVIITVYIPTLPKWKNPKERSKDE
jgi:hypothetical protein